MERAVKDQNILDRFATDFCRIVQKHCKYIIVSGFVAISTGRSRGTEDIDMIIPRLPEKIFTQLHEDLYANGYECHQSDKASTVYEYLANKDSVRYVRKEELLPEMEIKFAKDELDAYQLSTRQKIPSTGLDLWFSSIEMNIAFKEEYLKSDKDIADAKHLRIIFKEDIHESEIVRIKKMINRLRL